jgi:hypothetical protein
MRFYSIDVERELSAERLEIPADLVGHHLRLQCAAARLEAFDGAIRDCRRWSENRWRWLAGICKRTIRRLERKRLVRWDGDHLIVEQFNSYGIAALQQRRCEASKAAKRRWQRDASRTAGRTAGGTAKDRSATGDPTGDRSGSPPTSAPAKPSSSSIEVVEAGGGGGLPDGVWERIWAELPNRRSYWRSKAREAIEAVVVPDEVLHFLDFLDSGKKSRSWQKSPPTPLMIASDYRDRRRAPPAARAKSKDDRTPSPQLPSRAEIKASWTAVVNRSRVGKETGR